MNLVEHFELTVIGNVVLRDNNYLDAPVWIGEDLVKAGYIIESVKHGANHYKPHTSVCIEGLEFGGRSLI